MSLHITNKEELLKLLNPETADRIAPKVKPTKESKDDSKATKARIKTKRPVHVYILLALVSILAYLLLGLGWLIGMIGDSLYQVGKEMHESKWRIQ